jgi:hypothetical protein
VLYNCSEILFEGETIFSYDYDYETFPYTILWRFFFFLNLVKNVGVEQRKNAPLEEISTLLHCSSRRHLTGHAGGKIEKKHSPPSLATTE